MTNICEIFIIYSRNIALYLTNVVLCAVLSELDYLAEGLVDLTPVLAEVNGAEAEEVPTVDTIIFCDINIGFGVDHDALYL